MSNTRSIYSNRCWLEGKLQPATIKIIGGKITEIFSSKIPGSEDVGDNIMMPGIIDAHVHINEPGRTDWEGFETATQAAAAGGITTVVDMPLNASPVTTNLNAFKIKLEAAKDKLHVNVGFYGGLIPGNITELEPLMKAGILGIKCFLIHSGIDEFPNVNKCEIDEAMPVIAKYDLPLLAHCELFENEIEQQFPEDNKSYKNYLLSRPKSWENDAVNLMIRLCKKHNCRTHIVHVSSCEALDTILNAKKAGLPVTAETCAHYIYFDAENIPDADCLYKCAPPIREKENNDLLKLAFVNGILDFLTTDHSPAPPSIKEIESGDLKKAWGGIAGLQFLLPASWTAMKETISLEQFIPLLTVKPALFLKLGNRKGTLAAGYDADLVIWSPDEMQEVKQQDILHRHKISPYIGEELFGTIKET
ncbi:MAG: allantoinase AllB, partial [Ferruginibacter sp.]